MVAAVVWNELEIPVISCGRSANLKPLAGTKQRVGHLPE
jgi:hypothetical protein